MASNTVLNARTVAIVRELQTVKRTGGANGEFEQTDILIRIAVSRRYKATTIKNGQQVIENPTDFWLAKATGPVAERFAKYCTAKDETGKLKSRHLLIYGNFETYDKPRKEHITPQINFNGQIMQVDLDITLPDTRTIFIIENFEFLDSNPDANNANTNTETVVVGGITPVAQSGQATQPVQNAAQPAQMNVTQPVQAQPTQAVVQPVQVATPATTQATQVVDMNNVMNAPVVDPNFVATGEQAPF